MKILISDLDGCIFRTYETIDRLFHKTFGCSIRWKEVGEDASHPFWTTDAGLWVRQQFQNSRLYAHLPIYDEAKECLEIAAQQGWQILYLTSRHFSLETATIYSIGYHRLPFGDVRVIARYMVPQQKWWVCETLLAQGATELLAIEDELKVIQCLNQHGVKTWLIQQPHNTDGATWESAVQSWRALERKLKGGE